MIKSIRFSIFSLLFAGFMAFTFVSCDSEDGNGDNDTKVEFLSALQNTQWKHTSNDKIAFSTDTVTTTPVSGTEQDFKVKSSQTVDAINQTTYWFGTSQGTKDYVVYRDGAITSVNLGGIEKGQGWSLDSGTSGSQVDKTYIDPELIGQWVNNNNNNNIKFEFKYSDNPNVRSPQCRYLINGAVSGGFNNIYSFENKLYYYNETSVFYCYSLTNSNNTLNLYNSEWGQNFGNLTLTRSSFSW